MLFESPDAEVRDGEERGCLTEVPFGAQEDRFEGRHQTTVRASEVNAFSEQKPKTNSSILVLAEAFGQ